MNQDQLFHRYQDYLSYVGWSVADEDHVRAAATLLQPHLQPLIDDFYTEIGRHAETRKVIEGGHTTIEKLKGALLRWLQELLAGSHDREYLARRWQVGRRHVEVGLEQGYVSTALARLRAGLVGTLGRCWPGELEGLVSAILSLNKLLDLDLTIIENAYQTEYMDRIRWNEQLAKVGHVAGSVGHALRGPLNVLKTSAYYLRHALVPSPVKTAEHFQRIEKSMGVAEQILLELSDFAGMPAPKVHPFPVEPCVDEALVQISLPETIQVSRDFPPSLPRALGDRNQVRKVFVCLIRRARDIMRDGGRLSIRIKHVADAVEVAYEDTGVHLAQAELAALEAPLSWSNVRILGLTLAVARALLDGNAGRLRAKNESSRGCTMTVTLATVLQESSERSSSSVGTYPGASSV
jgi:signal transduction histidine kinase